MDFLFVRLPHKKITTLGGDRIDLDLGKRLSVPDVASITDLGLVLDHGNFFRASLALHLGRHLGAADHRCSDFCMASILVANQEHIKRDAVSRFTLELLNRKLLSFTDEILFSSCMNNSK